MSVLDSSQYLLTLQQPLIIPEAEQGLMWVHGEPSLLNKDLWCGDVTSWQAITMFDVESLLVDEGARWYPAEMDVDCKEERK